MVPIIPAIPRSLEKRKPKEDAKGNKDGRGSGSPIGSISPEGIEESHVETAIASTPAIQDETLHRAEVKASGQEIDTQETVVDCIEDVGSEKEASTAQGTATFRSTLVRTNKQKPTTFAADDSNVSAAQSKGSGIEKHGSRLPPPFYPMASPPPAISTNFSSANEKAIASEETSQTAEEANGSTMSKQCLTKNHVTLNATAPAFHAHPNPPTDITTSPTESSCNGYDLAQSVHQHQEPTSPIDENQSPIQTYHGYEASQNISFYAPPQSSNDPSSPNHSVYQGYAYVPASYSNSPPSNTSHHPVGSPYRTDIGISYEQRYGHQPPSYGNESPYTVLGSQPPLTPSRTPLDPSVPPWSSSNGLLPTMPFSYGHVGSYDPPSESRVRSTSQEPRKSDESAPKNGPVYDGSKSDPLDVYEAKTAQMVRGVWRSLNNCFSSHVPLVEHLLQQFNVDEYADCQLTLVHENLRFAKTTWSLSSLLLIQSYKLRALLKSAGPSENGKVHLEIRLTDRFVTPWAMDSALRVLYGERPEMFTLAMIRSTFNDMSPQSWIFQMDACLGFAAAGHVLGLDHVVSQGLQVACSVLDWDNLDHALSFGLESGPNRGNSASADVIPRYYYSPVCSRESDPSSTLNLTPPSSSAESGLERSGQPSSNYEGILSISSDIIEVRSASELQTRCLQWIASNLDDTWHFDPSARPLAEVDRLPTTAESRSPLFKSRLSRIQFGDHPSEMHAKASDRNSVISSVVLSLPFTALKYVLDLGTQPILRQLHAIVKERERRRQIVLQSKSVPWDQRLAARDHEWAEVGYTESVETATDGQVSLARKATGIDRQMSEPSTPD